MDHLTCNISNVNAQVGKYSNEHHYVIAEHIDVKASVLEEAAAVWAESFMQSCSLMAVDTKKSISDSPSCTRGGWDDCLERSSVYPPPPRCAGSAFVHLTTDSHSPALQPQGTVHSPLKVCCVMLNAS